MKYAVDSMKMKSMDDYTTSELGIPAMELMERAAQALVACMRQRITTTDRIIAICGTGNNGGDGVAACRLLHQQGYMAAICLIGEEAKYTDQMRKQLKLAEAAGVVIENCDRLSEYNIIIDAIFGVGLSKPVMGEQEAMIRRINEQKAIVYAVDIPSGISADHGRIMNVAVKADVTVTFGQNKIGLLLYPGAEYAGSVMVADIGFPDAALCQVRPDTFYFEPEDIRRLPKREKYSHKGTYGKVLIIAGSKGMCGAALLSARAAYRSGAGLVKVLTAECNRIILQTALPEALFAAYDEDLDADEKQQRLLAELAWASVIVIGPGIGQSRTAVELVDTVLHKAKAPVIVDADAINILAGKLNSMEKNQPAADVRQRLNRLEELLGEQTILTPHLMELSRLAGIKVEDLACNLLDTARQCSYHSKLIYVIKDARTIVTELECLYINVSGNPGMATGGSGDVLSGMIAAFLAQGIKAFDAACLGVYVHGLSGDAAAKEKGTFSLMAGDIAGAIEKVLINLE